MSTEFNWAICAVIPASAVESAGEAIAASTSNPEDTATFSIPLSESGGFPATHYACNTVVRQGFYQQIPALMGAITGASAFDIRPYEFNFEGQKFALIEASSFEGAIESLGLKFARPPIPNPPQSQP